MRYHFHIRDDAGLIRDEEGGEFPDLARARIEACASARDLVADDLRCGRSAPARRIEIADEGGTVLECVGIAVVVN
jgi:hypothetical protein